MTKQSGFAMTLTLTIVGCLAFLSTPALAVIPDSDNPDAYTEKQFRLDLLDYKKRSMAQAYLEVGKRDAKWDDLAVELLDAQAVYYTNSRVFTKAHVPGEVTKEHRIELVNQIKELGCDDPYLRFICLRYSDDTEEGYRDQAMAVCHAMLDSEYPISNKISACWHMARYLKEEGLEDEAAAWVQRWVDLICKSVDDPNLSLQDQYFIFRMSEDEIKREWLPRWQAAWQRIEGKEVANPWLALAICGFYHTEAAWELRSHSYDYTEHHDGWDEFAEHLRVAHEQLSKAWELAPQFPVVSYKLIKISVCQNAGEERKWFERAVAAQVDYYPAYSQYLWASRPRWGGSLDQMYAFAVECLDTGRFDTRIPELFYEAMIQLHAETKDYSYWQRPGVYETIVRYYEGKKHEPGGRSAEAWWDSMKAATAWRIGRYEQAAQQMEQSGETFNINAFSKFGGEPILTASEVYVRLNPDTDAAADSVDRLWRQGRHRRAAELLDATLAELASDDPARVYLENKAAQSRWKHRDQQGVWADLLGRTDMGGWDVERGEWSMDEQGRLTGHSLDNGLAAVCRLKFGYRYELKGSLECLRSPDPEQANGGVLMAYQVDGAWAYHRDVLIYPQKQSVLAARTFKYATEDYPAELQPKNSFHLQVWDRHVRLIVNDVVVIEHRVMPRSLPRTIYRFALGGYYTEPGGSIRYDELTIRRLHSRPDWLDAPVP